MSADESDAPRAPRSAELPAESTLERLSLLTEALDPIAPPPAVRVRLLQQLAGSERWTPHARRVAAGFGLALGDVTEALRRVGDATAWQAFAWPGSRQLIAPKLAAAHTMILELPASFQIARHRHVSRELTYVLDGELIENRQERHGSGTMLEYSRGTEHEVACSGRGPCLVVFGLRSGD